MKTKEFYFKWEEADNVVELADQIRMEFGTPMTLHFVINLKEAE